MTARYIPLAVFLLLVVLTSYVATGFEAGEWYHAIMTQPSNTPPDWLNILAPAVVYVLMALAAWKIWLTGHYSRLGTLTWWVLLLVLSSGWSAVFYGMHRPGWALPVLGLMLGGGLLCTWAFSRLSRDAALLMLPYLAWTVYLLFFDYAVWSTNGGSLETVFR